MGLEFCQEFTEYLRGIIRGDSLTTRYKCPYLIRFIRNNPNLHAPHLMRFLITHNNDEQPRDEKGRFAEVGSSISSIRDKVTGKTLNAVEGEPITNRATLAGTKGKPPVKQAQNLTRQYGGTAENWTKRTQDMTIDDNGVHRRAEVHYFHEPSVGAVDVKIKDWRKGKT